MNRIIKITEEAYNYYVNGEDVLNEDVYASNKKGKNRIQLTYNKRKSANQTKNFGQLNPAELLNTGKMDQNNSDTYEVPLKGGIMSYNITSIRGTEIMHYFKNKHAKMNVDLDGDGQKESYDLWMNDAEYREFLNQFSKKVSYVVSWAINDFKTQSNGNVNFTGVSIYPVPSSSGFNERMATDLANNMSISGLNVIKINQSMFKKDLTNLQKDTDFVNKNKEYYKSNMWKYGEDNTTHEQYLDKTLSDYKNTEDIRNNVNVLINEYNILYAQLDRCYNTNRKQYGDRFPEALAKFYKKLYDKMQEIYNALKQGRNRALEASQIFGTLKGTKSQVEARKTEDVWNIVKPYFRGSGVSKIPMHRLEAKKFQIKNLPNNVRMGMKNYFLPNSDMVKQEMDKIKGTVFVIFDDNISGGATLSDICMQAKQLGIDYIVPITFGEMNAKYSLGVGKQINKPTKSGRFENY